MLGELASPDSRSSYAAVNNLTFQLSYMIAALFITLGQVPFWVIPFCFWLMGSCSIYLFSRIMNCIPRHPGDFEIKDGKTAL